MGLVSRQNLERTAILLEDGDSVSYATLHRDIHLFCPAIRKGSFLFIVGENDYPSLLCYLTCLERGAVPLLLGAGIHEQQLRSLLAIYKPQFVWSRNQAHAQPFSEDIVGEFDGYRLAHLSELMREEGQASPRIHEDLALLLATSGTSGSPKLVRLTLPNLQANAASIIKYLEICPEERAITSLPFHYSYGMSVINSHLFAGASLVLTNRSILEQPFWQLVQKHEVTSFSGVPYHYEMLLRMRFASLKIPSVRTMTQAGGRLESTKLERVYQTCVDKRIRFYSMYGQTEAGPRISYLPSEDTLSKLGSIGVAIPGGTLQLQDENGTLIVEPGKLGELVYFGENVCMGYAETSEDLQLGDINKGRLKTGDIGRFDNDGYFFLEGRIQRFVKVFGIRVAMDAVEVLIGDHGFQCAAVGRDDLLTLFVVNKVGLVPEVLRSQVASSLGIHPSGIQVQILEELPRLETGKTNYQWLKEQI